MNIFKFYTLGCESFSIYNNYFIKSFVKNFGPLGINAKIRSGHVIQNIKILNLNGDKNISVLDVGSGVSYIDFWLANQFPNWNIFGVDIDSDAISKSLQIKSNISKYNVDFQNISILDFSLKEKYDLVYSMDVLEHIQDDVTALEIIYQAMKNHGFLILHLPLSYKLCKRILPGFKDFFTHDHVRDEYTYEEISKKLEDVGFKIINNYYSYSVWGELAFELNYLFWKKPKIRLFLAFIFHFFSNLLAYIDIKNQFNSGNGIVIVARK